MRAPTKRKWPEHLWSSRHELSNGDNGLPARIQTTVRRRRTREYTLRSVNDFFSSQSSLSLWHVISTLRHACPRANRNTQPSGLRDEFLDGFCWDCVEGGHGGLIKDRRSQ
jgi:hypothetical protein